MMPKPPENSKAPKSISDHPTVENDLHHRIRLTLSFKNKYKFVESGSVDRFIRPSFVRASDCGFRKKDKKVAPTGGRLSDLWYVPKAKPMLGIYPVTGYGVTD